MSRIHPSATLFAAVLLAFALPFGYSAQACGSTTAPYRGVDLLVGDVQPDGDVEYAEEMSATGLPLSWLLLASALTGLLLAIWKRGKLWATLCTVTATAAFVLGVALDLNPDVGWVIAFFVPVVGVAVKVLAAIARAIGRLESRPAKVAVTTVAILLALGGAAAGIGLGDSGGPSEEYAGISNLDAEAVSERHWRAAGGKGPSATYVEQSIFDGHDAWLASQLGLVPTDLCLWFWDDGAVWERCSGQGTVEEEFAHYERMWPALGDAYRIATRLCNHPAGFGERPRELRRIIRRFEQRHRGADGVRQGVALLRPGCYANA